MSDYNRHLNWRAYFLKLIAFGLTNWLWVLIVAFIVSAEGPHLRVSYSYTGPLSEPWQMDDCSYLGSRGFVKASFYNSNKCPVIAWLDARELRP